MTLNIFLYKDWLNNINSLTKIVRDSPIATLIPSTISILSLPNMIGIYTWNTWNGYDADNMEQRWDEFVYIIIGHLEWNQMGC